MEPTTPNTGTTTSVALRYGLLTGLLGIIFSFVLFITNSDQSPVRWLGLVITVGGMVMAHTQFKQANNGFMEYSQGLGIGTLMGMVGGLLNTAFNYVYMTFIDPGYMGRVMDVTRAKMEEKGTMSDEQIDQAMTMMAKFSGGGWVLLFGALGSLLFAFIIALVVSAITKNSKPQFE
jgi:hypothetical protein